MGNVQSKFIEPINEIGSKIFNQNKYEFFNTNPNIKPNESNTYWSILNLNTTQM